MTHPVSMGTFESVIVESSTPRQRILPSFRECFGEIIRANPVSLPNSMSLNAGGGVSEEAIQSVAGKRKSDSLSKRSGDLTGTSENSRRKSTAKKSEGQNKRFYSSDLRSLPQENQPHAGSIHNISNPVGNTRLFRSTLVRISDQMEYFLKAIDLDPRKGCIYSNLGSTLPKNRSICLLNGQVMSTQDLFLKAIDLDPGQGCIYSNLGCELPKNGSIRLLNGQVMSKHALFLKAIDLDPKNAGAYNNLACMLSRDGSICLLNGQIMSKQDLSLKAIDLDPEDGRGYNNLGFALPKNGSIRLLNGQVMSKQGLFLKALDLNPESSAAYNNLALTLPDNGIIRLLNGRSMSKRELFLKALELKAKAA